MTGGRPRNTLVERVVRRSFRPGRYGYLLEGATLPPEPPTAFTSTRRWGDDYVAALWEHLRQLQAWFCAVPPEDSDERSLTAHEFAEVMHHLHGARRPGWLREALEAEGWDLDDEPTKGGRWPQAPPD